MLLVLDAAAVRSWCEACRSALAAARQEIDDLNVFPVPDGDTGTNLLLTMDSALLVMRQAPADLRATTAAVAHGALLGARGNSGLILSQLLQGLADVLGSAESPDGAALARGLVRGADLAYAALATPLEGTVLSVARDAGRAATDSAATPGTDLLSVAVAALAAATTTLGATMYQLAALRHAGVVDAGGRGLCVVLGALVEVLSGRYHGSPDEPAGTRDEGPVVTCARHAEGPQAYGYEVQYLLRGASPGALAQLRGALARIGDSVVVAAGVDVASVHAHVDDVGAALEAGVDTGRPSDIRVTRFADGRTSRPPAEQTRAPGRRHGVVAVAAGDGLARLFRDGGAVVVPPASLTSDRLLEAALETGASHVVLLPNDAAVGVVAAAAARDARRHGVELVVLPTSSAVQGLAALAVRDPDRPFEADCATMSAAAGATRWGSVVLANEEAQTAAGPCRPGDALGLLAGRTVLVGGLEEVATGLVEAMLGSSELVTVVLGRQAPADIADRVKAYVATYHPAVFTSLLDGGQPDQVLLLGAE